MNEENKRLIGEITNVVWNHRSLDRIPAFYAPDCVAVYRPHAPLREGHEGMRGMVERAWTAFPDYHEALHALLAEGDRVVAHMTIPRKAPIMLVGTLGNVRDGSTCTMTDG